MDGSSSTGDERDLVKERQGTVCQRGKLTDTGENVQKLT